MKTRNSLRADYIHDDKYAALGLATLEREPLAFRSVPEREALGFSLAKYLPPALSLSEVAKEIP